jgi:hypothetical protein
MLKLPFRVENKLVSGCILISYIGVQTLKEKNNMANKKSCRSNTLLRLLHFTGCHAIFTY